MTTDTPNSDRPPLEWEVIFELKAPPWCVMVSRAKGRRMFSMRIGSLAQDGRVFIFIPMRWQAYEVEGRPEVSISDPDPQGLEQLVKQAQDRVRDILVAEGVRPRLEDRDRPVQRKGKTERDRSRRQGHGS
jgi:hypothetical protein